MAQNNKKSIISYLIRLMKHVFKWLSEPDKQSKSWENSIVNSRENINKLQLDKPSLNDDFLKSKWDKSQKTAKKEAENEMKQPTDINNLTWKQVFEDKYKLETKHRKKEEGKNKKKDEK